MESLFMLVGAVCVVVAFWLKRSAEGCLDDTKALAARMIDESGIEVVDYAGEGQRAVIDVEIGGTFHDLDHARRVVAGAVARDLSSSGVLARRGLSVGTSSRWAS